jgi:hypothetical protein
LTLIAQYYIIICVAVQPWGFGNIASTKSMQNEGICDFSIVEFFFFELEIYIPVFLYPALITACHTPILN